MSESRKPGTDWKKLGAALDPPVSEAEVEKIAPVLDALQSAFRPLQRSLPPDADLWTPADIA
jgi:hypothetical protein